MAAIIDTSGLFHLHLMAQNKKASEAHEQVSKEISLKYQKAIGKRRL